MVYTAESRWIIVYFWPWGDQNYFRMVYTASSRWLIVNLGTISHTLLNLLFNIGKSFTVKATKNKQINKKLATISLTKKYRSKKNQTLLLSCLMIHSTRPQWPFLAIFAQKIFAAATRSREPHLDFTKKPIKFACTFVCRK